MNILTFILKPYGFKIGDFHCGQPVIITVSIYFTAIMPNVIQLTGYPTLICSITGTAGKKF